MYVIIGLEIEETEKDIFSLAVFFSNSIALFSRLGTTCIQY